MTLRATCGSCNSFFPAAITSSFFKFLTASTSAGKFWDLPAEVKDGIGQELEAKIHFLFDKLNAVNTKQYVTDSVQPVPIAPILQDEIQHA